MQASMLESKRAHEWPRLADLPPDLIGKKLAVSGITLELGCFRHYISGQNKAFLRHFLMHYGDAQIAFGANYLTEHQLTLGAPHFLRKYVRPQVVADPGFASPVAPLPARLGPLAFEMGVNLSVALTCFRLLVLHSAVVARPDGKAIMICAPSGGGKSTLTAYLMSRGYRMLSDEFGLLSLDGDLLHAYPRPVSLKNDSIEIVKGFWPHVGPTLIGSPKGRIAYATACDMSVRQANPAVPFLLLMPEFGRNLAPHAVRMDRVDAAMALINSSPNYTTLGGRSYKALEAFTAQTAAYQIKYASSEEAFDILQSLEKAHG